METKLEYILYPGKEGLESGAEMVPKLYARLITLKDGEEEKWNRLWREELQIGELLKGRSAYENVG